MVFVGDIHRYGRLSEWFLLVISIVIVGENNDGYHQQKPFISPTITMDITNKNHSFHRQ
jgi:hypothetical protein